MEFFAMWTIQELRCLDREEKVPLLFYQELPHRQKGLQTSSMETATLSPDAAFSSVASGLKIRLGIPASEIVPVYAVTGHRFPAQNDIQRVGKRSQQDRESHFGPPGPAMAGKLGLLLDPAGVAADSLHDSAYLLASS
jgi:hypothetical protein